MNTDRRIAHYTPEMELGAAQRDYALAASRLRAALAAEAALPYFTWAGMKARRTSGDAEAAEQQAWERLAALLPACWERWSR